MAIKTHKNHPLYELGTVPLQEGRMPKQDLGNRLVQSYWIELSEGAERKAPLLETGFFFWRGQDRRRGEGRSARQKTFLDAIAGFLRRTDTHCLSLVRLGIYGTGQDRRLCRETWLDYGGEW